MDLTRSSVGDYVRVALASFTGSCLIRPADLAQIEKTAAFLPASLTSFFGFEAPLGEDEGQTDFLVCVADLGRPALLRTAMSLSAAGASPEWSRVAAFTREWADSTSALHTEVHNLWLEFDTVQGAASILKPSVFFGSSSLRFLHPSESVDQQAERCRWLTTRALPSLRGISVSQELSERLRECLSVLPATAYVFQLGVMLSRAEPVVRVCVRGLALDEVTDYLQKIGWSGDYAAVRRVLDSLSPTLASMSLDLDVGERVGPKLGMECYLLPGVAHLDVFLEALSELCTPQKAAALRAWHGIVPKRVSKEPWPRDLCDLDQMLGHRFLSVFYRSFHHVKIVCQPDKPLAAKAYLAVHHRWTEPQLFRNWLSTAARDDGKAPSLATQGSASC